MKKTKEQKGITLIALIITIIVLLILAVVAIKEVQGDGIIAYAQRAKAEQIQEQEEEKIMLAVNEWKIVSNTEKDKNFSDFMKEKFGAENVTETEDESLEITMENGNKYNVTELGVITLAVEETPIIPDEEEKTEIPTTDTTQTQYGTWTLGNDGLTVTNGTITLNIGEKVTANSVYTYSEEGIPNVTYSGEWYIFGAESGKIKLISAKSVFIFDHIYYDENDDVIYARIERRRRI